MGVHIYIYNIEFQVVYLVYQELALPSKVPISTGVLLW